MIPSEKLPTITTSLKKSIPSSAQGFPPALIQIEDQQKYYTAIGKGDMGEFKSMVQMVCESTLKGYSILFSLPDRF